MMIFGKRLADRFLLKLVPQLKASACCSASGYQYCCQNVKDCPSGSTLWTCVLGCYCQVLAYCYVCTS